MSGHPSWPTTSRTHSFKPENCISTKATVPAIISRIREIGQGFGAVHTFNAYADTALYLPTTRADVTSAGVSLIDCAHHGQDQVADGILIGELYMLFRPRDVSDVLCVQWTWRFGPKTYLALLPSF